MRRNGILLAIAFALFFAGMPCASAQTSAPAKATVSADDSGNNREKEGCNLLPYTGEIPLSKLPYYFPGQPDLRGGVVCRYRVGPDLPFFKFYFLGNSDNTLGKLEISQETGTTIVQTVEQSTDWGMVSSASELETNLLTPIDANFDGYQDLQILSNCGATGNCSYDFFLYDPVTNQFVHNEFLSNTLCSPDFDAKKKQITTHSNSSASDWERDTYQYVDSRYTLIRREVSGWDRTTDRVTVNTYELRNGKMELVDSDPTP